MSGGYRTVTIAGLCLLMVAATAGGEVAWDFVQITQTPYGFGMFEPSISVDGCRVAFRTSADLTGQNPDNTFEVFVWDCGTGTFTQLGVTPTGFADTLPMITADGSKVVFRSNFDHNTGAGATDTFELWEADVATGAIRQVTDNPASTPVFDPRISGDGSWLVFVSRINPTGGNADGSLEVFRINRVTGVLNQISNNATQAAQYPDINGDGSVVVWGDRANYDGTNGNAGLEIWKWDANTNPPTITSVTRQTASVLETYLPRVDYAGRYVCFLSLYDFSGGGATGRKVFVADTSTNPAAITRITSTGVGGSGADVPDAEISPDGSTVFFESNINLNGLNPDTNRELFAYRIATNTLSNVTNKAGGTNIVPLSDDATRRYLDVAPNLTITYRDDRDLDPNVINNPANLDLFRGLPRGSCCHTDGTCTLTPEADCTGTWTMFGTCEPNTCQQPTGSCCHADGTCSVALQAECAGFWTMFGTCEADPCVCGDFCTAVSPPYGAPDGLVDYSDYWYIHDGLGTCAPQPAYVAHASADLDHDGCITLIDYRQWLTCYRAANGRNFVPPKSVLPIPMPGSGRGEGVTEDHVSGPVSLQALR